MDFLEKNAENIAAAVKILQDKEYIAGAYIHGSALTENFRGDSDIDIAVIPDPAAEIATIEKLELTADLSSVLGREVHLGILSTNQLIFSKQVLTSGKLLFTKNNFQTDIFRCTALSMYFDLKRKNREIRDAYSA
ncbi:MAG: type VII toxin-antitoxin system MntA family adenylyltransferase antitoxin [Planctomycetota bacterium]|jgi:predicted nucleotidyltransferase